MSTSRKIIVLRRLLSVQVKNSWSRPPFLLSQESTGVRKKAEGVTEVIRRKD